MLVKEYRICMPMTVEEYRIAQLYMIQKKSREESTGRESGVEILKNEPYTDGPGGNGQYTFKIYHVGSHLPGWLRSIIPDSALRVEEEAWNAYPYTKTRYKVPFVEKFSLEIETKYLDDGGDTENVFEMSPSELSARIVDFIDIVTDPAPPSKPTEDPSTYVSQVTGRGPLPANWRTEFKKAMLTGEKYACQGTKPDKTGSTVNEPLPKRIMCSYKVCRVEFRYWGMQSRIENFIQDIALRRTMVSAHRQAWTWQDEWYGMTMTEIRRLEAETARALAMKMGQDEEVAKKAVEGGTEEAPAVPSMNFGSCLSFASESEQASMFQSIPGSDVDDEDFYDTRSVNINGEVSPGFCTTASEGNQCFTSEEVSQSNILLFIVQGGFLREKRTDESSTLAEFFTFRSTLESTVANHFPEFRSRLIIRSISCPALVTGIHQLLKTIDPATPESTSSETDVGPTRKFTSLGNIPLLLTTSSHYPRDLHRLAQQLNGAYIEFRDSADGLHFSGNVCLVADSLGSIMLYDLLSSPELANRNNEAFTKLENIQHIPDGSSLLFDVQDVFFLGSPLGLLLSLRQRIGIQSNRRVGCGFGFPSPIRPACEQVFNIFDITDPFAYRLEPLLDAAFEGVPVIRLPACGSWDSSQRRGLRRQLLMIPSTEISSKQIPASITSVLHPFLGIDFTQKTSHYATGNTMRSDWWGYQRMDLGLHCQEGGKNVISQSLPTAYYRYWESKGVSYFIVWQLVERLHRGCFSVRGDNAQCIQSGGVVLGEEHGLKLSSPFRTHSSSPSMCCTEQGVSFSNPGFFSGGGGGAGGLSRQFRSSISSRLRFKSRPPDRTKASCLPYSMTSNPNHRANDAIVLDGRPQIIAARFTFGTLDLLSMANEEIEVLCRPQMVNCDKPQNWKSLGRQCTDSNGRLAFQIPDAHRLPIGLHRIQLVPSSGDPDEQTVGLTMAIVPPGCDVVICSIDGSFAASLSLMGKDPKVRAGSVDIMRHWHSLGYLLIYMSARPDMQHRQVSMWLNQHNFPPGLTFFLDGLFTDPLRQKAVLLKSLIEQNQLSVHCAYGSAKDVPIYRSLGLQAHQIFAVGKLSRRQAQEATPIREGYAAHFMELMDQNHLSVPATGPMSSAVLQKAPDPSSAPPDVSPFRRSVFFDLPDSKDTETVLPS